MVRRGRARSRRSTSVRVIAPVVAAAAKVSLKPKVGVDTLLMQAASPTEAQRARGMFDVVTVANPNGEVWQSGNLRPHSAVKRVSGHEYLFRRKAIDAATFRALDWYARQLALAEGGLVRCALNQSGTGAAASPTDAIPYTASTAAARAAVERVRRRMPATMLAVFDGVMRDGDTLQSIGSTLWPEVSASAATRRAATTFRSAAVYARMMINKFEGYCE